VPWYEVMLVLVFILIFFGSKSIPGLARTFGQTIRKVKDASQEIQTEIKKSTLDMKSELDLTGIIQSTTNDIKRPLDQYANDIEDVVSRRPIHSHAKKPIVSQQIEEAQVTEEPQENKSASEIVDAPVLKAEPKKAPAKKVAPKAKAIAAKKK
jgi:sec-independent protein translocase protein TatA